MDRLFLIIGAIFGALAVTLGAFGAHALRASLSPELLDTFESAVRYQMYHALGLLAVGLAIAKYSATGWLSASGWLFVVGTILFSGSLYLLAITNTRWLGAVTPFGGIAFILGWLCLAFGIWQA